MKKEDEKEKLLVAFGKAILELRTENNWSQEELADYAGLERASILRIENGKNDDVLLGTILKLSRAFKMHPEKLISYTLEIQSKMP